MPEEENRIQIIEFYSGTHAIKINSHMLVTLLWRHVHHLFILYHVEV